MKLIDKSALVAEIERRVTEGEKVAKELPSSAIMGLIQAYKNLLSFIDSLEEPCNDCVNRKGCINCIDGSLKETNNH